MNELATVSHKAKKIGIQLGVPNHIIKDYFDKDRDIAFSEIMDYWLNKNTEVPATWGVSCQCPGVSSSWGKRTC